jgi:Tfp pilus assembly protein PilF
MTKSPKARLGVAGGMALAAAFFSSDARVQERQTVTPQQLMSWCQGQDGATPDQMIAGCTVMIEAGQSSAHNKSVAHTNRGDAYRSKGDHDQAIRDLDEAIKIDPSNQFAHSSRGVLHFVQADFPAAAAAFRQAASLKPDAYPVVWHYLARARGGGDGANAAAAELAANAAPLKTTEWPYPVVELYLGRRAGSDLLAVATTPDDRCEAQFYLGEWHLLRGNSTEAAKALREAAATCPKTFYEYAGAAAELSRLR